MASAWLGVGMGLVMLSGCAAVKRAQIQTVPKYEPSNVFLFSPTLPPPIRRLAVLPITWESGDWKAEVGRAELQSILGAELSKAKVFELVMVSPEQLNGLTGKPGWRADEKLPAELFDQLRESLDCDAVMFPHLAAYHPFTPIVVGWNIKLVEVTGHYILWSVDEVFDAKEPRVADAADAYERQHDGIGLFGQSERSITLSPREFAQYTLDAIFETLPRR